MESSFLFLDQDWVGSEGTLAVRSFAAFNCPASRKQDTGVWTAFGVQTGALPCYTDLKQNKERRTVLGYAGSFSTRKSIQG